MIRAIAIDDEPLGLKIISNFCEKTDFIKLEATYTNQTEALNYIKKNQIDLLFLDIQMPSKNGIDFYKMLNADLMVIFTTAYSEYAVEGFNLNATDYLLKPFSEERFMVAVQKAKNELLFRQSITTQNHLIVRSDYKLLRIEFDDILLIEGLDDYTQIHLQDSSKIVARISMKNILEKLPASQFIRAHRSYIVPVNRIKAIKSKNLLIDSFVIPVGDTYREEILKLFQ